MPDRDFMDPSLRLWTADDVRTAVLQPGLYERWREEPGHYLFRVRADWLVSLIAEIEATGQYPYNVTVQREAEKRLGIDRQPDESGSALGILVYNAQGFRRSDKNIARGLSPFDQSMIDEAGDGGKIELDGGTVLNVRRIEGKLWALKPRARRYAVAAIGQPAKILKRGKKPAAV